VIRIFESSVKAVAQRLPRYNPDFFLLVFDLTGVFVFAVEGALAGIAANLDLLGILVLSFATALGGGMIRDLLIGAIPPNSVRDWRYPATAFAGGGAVFLAYNVFQSVPTEMMITLDAAGLALCAVAGADKSMSFGINPMLSVLMGGVTGVGGGTVRDIFLARVPGVLKADVYAAAALAGAAVVVVGLKLKLPKTLAMSLGAIVCFALRMEAVSRHWNLPKVMVH
jgi:uncharacterized membrane protein YeiH